MAIQRYAGDRITGLSTDAKPTNIMDGAVFYETDTTKIYLKVSGSWAAVEGYSGYSGYSGSDGTSGYSGYSGADGASGYSGEQGLSGYSGYSGISGYSGAGGGGTSNLTVVDKTDDYQVLTSDLAKVLTMTATTEKTFTLPSVGSSDIGLYFTFVKLGTGNLVIQASDSDTILDSNAGGTLSNTTADDIYSSVTLLLISETKWIVKEATSGYWVTSEA